MEEENKQELVEVKEEPKQEVTEQQKQEQSSGLSENNKYSLITFILATLGLLLCHGWFIGKIRNGNYADCVSWVIAGIACAVLGIIANKRVKNLNADKQPFKTFDKFSKPVAIVDIPLGFTVAAIFVARIIYLIIFNLTKQFFKEFKKGHASCVLFLLLFSSFKPSLSKTVIKNNASKPVNYKDNCHNDNGNLRRDNG